MGLQTLPGAGILGDYCMATDLSGFYQNVDAEFQSALDSSQDKSFSGNLTGGSIGLTQGFYTGSDNVFIALNGSAHYGSGSLEDEQGNSYSANEFGARLDLGPKFEFDSGSYSNSSTFVFHPYAFAGMNVMTVKDAIPGVSPADGSTIMKDMVFMNEGGPEYGVGARTSWIHNDVAITAASEIRNEGQLALAARVGLDISDYFNMKCGENTAQVFLQGNLNNATSTVDMGNLNLGDAQAQTWGVSLGVNFNL